MTIIVHSIGNPFQLRLRFLSSVYPEVIDLPTFFGEQP
jgi:hypothetical protein